MKKVIFLLVFLVGFTLVGCNELEPILTVTNKDVTIEVGDTHDINALLDNADDKAVIKYLSNDITIATVSAEGTITGIKAGNTTISITVEGYDNLKATVSLTVKQGEVVDQITVTGPTTVVAGESIQLTIVDKLDSGNGIMIVSLNQNVAKSTNDGKITGVTAGTAEFEIHSLENGFNIKISIEVTEATVESVNVKANIDGTKIKTTANYKLIATVLPKAADQEVVWTSDDDSIATIDELGNVRIATYGEVTFTAKSIQNNEILDKITVEFYWDVMDIIDYVIVENPIIQRKVTAIGYQFNYDVDVLGSVSNYYFGNYQEYEKIAPLGGNRPGIIKTSTEYITIHDTASTAASAGSTMHANYVYTGGGGTSWHFSIGNDGVWKQLPLDEVAYHAGDGSRVFELIDTGVKVTSKIKPKVEIDTAGYYTLNGERSTILAPKSDTGATLTTAFITKDGVTLEIGKNGNWFMNKTWYSTSYKKIGNYGGNRNSVGIESMVNQGSDLYLTWHYTAKKASELALEYNLGIDRIVTHEFFSGKYDPLTLKDNGLFPNFRKMIEAEYLINKFLGDYKLTFVSNNPELVDNTGRILKIPTTNTQVSFLVTVENSATGFNQSKIYYSTIPAV